jgi:RNA polymerase sigma factor (sigma-70 family)
MEHDEASLPALEDVYRRRYRAFLRVALALVGERERAHDAVQEAFARALRARHTLRSQERLEPFLWATLVNVCRDERRRERVGALAAPARNGQAESWPELRAAIAALPERQRLALFLRYYADLDYESIAGALGVERGTVAASLHAAHGTLRAKLKEAPR